MSAHNLCVFFFFFFFLQIKKNNVYACKPQFYYIKVGFKVGQNYIGVFSEELRTIHYLVLVMISLIYAINMYVTVTFCRPRWLSWIAPSDWRPGDRGFNPPTPHPPPPRRGRQHSFVGIDHEIFSTVILSLPLIQEGQLSVSGERMCTILVNRLGD